MTFSSFFLLLLFSFLFSTLRKYRSHLIWKAGEKTGGGYNFILIFIYSEDNDDNLDKSGEENGEIEEIIVSLVSLFGETMRLFRGGRGSPFDDVKL